MYQVTLSPDHGPMASLYPEGFCRFHPTCSEYAYQSIEKRGVCLGLWRSVVRLARCNPFSRGGVDPVK